MTYEEIKKKIEACTDLGIVEEKETEKKGKHSKYN